MDGWVMKKLYFFRFSLLGLVFCLSLVSCSDSLSDNKRNYLTLAASNITNAKILNEDQKNTVLKDMRDFIRKSDEACPCLLPEKETEPKYMISTDEKKIIEQYKLKLKNEGLDATDKEKQRANELQQKHFDAYTKTGIPAERYMLRMLAEKEINNENATKDTLLLLRNITSLRIIELDQMIKKTREELDPVFLEFSGAELKTFIQVRKSIIDELAKR